MYVQNSLLIDRITFTTLQSSDYFHRSLFARIAGPIPGCYYARLATGPIVII